MNTGKFEFEGRRIIEYKIDENGCFICTSHHQEWSGHVRYTFDGKQSYMHRFIYSQLVAQIPKGYSVMHLCDNPPCINPAHLKAGTHQDNMNDRTKKSRGRGKGTRPKLTEKEILDIIENKDGLKLVDLASKHGVHYTHVVKIRNGERYADIGRQRKKDPKRQGWKHAKLTLDGEKHHGSDCDGSRETTDER